MMKVLGVEQTTNEAGQPVTTLEFEMSQRYRHTFGFNSEFFRGLGEGILQATRCPSCACTYFPPKAVCSRDLHQTEWYGLPGTGTVVSATRVHIAPPFGGIEAPYVLATIQLDGVDGGLMHRILGPTPPPSGTPVVVEFLPDNSGHPLLGIAFSVVEESSP